MSIGILEILKSKKSFLLIFDLKAIIFLLDDAKAFLSNQPFMEFYHVNFMPKVLYKICSFFNMGIVSLISNVPTNIDNHAQKELQVNDSYQYLKSGQIIHYAWHIDVQEVDQIGQLIVSMIWTAA